MPVLDKAPILAALKDYWSQGQSGGGEFGSFSVPVANAPLAGLMPFVRDRHIVYRRSPSGEEYLGL